MKLVEAVGVSLGLVAVMGCGSENSPTGPGAELVGRWERTDSEISFFYFDLVEFLPNGGVVKMHDVHSNEDDVVEVGAYSVRGGILYVTTRARFRIDEDGTIHEETDDEDVFLLGWALSYSITGNTVVLSLLCPEQSGGSTAVRTSRRVMDLNELAWTGA